MSTFLFDDIVFGPVKSRRFGVSLGINLLPLNYKYCTFNCIYCECGWTFKKNSEKINLAKREDIKKRLEEQLIKMKEEGKAPDNITFAGNGEPTVHPKFAEIIDDTIVLRNEYFPKAEITVLSNSSMLHKKQVFEALNKIDNNVLKLDSAIEETFQKINQPIKGLTIKKIIKEIKKFEGNQLIQTLFIRGKLNNKLIDNTSVPEIEAWLNALKEIKPKSVMLYPIERDTPAEDLIKVPKEELLKIAEKVEAIGIKTQVY
jgi:wyosine [tRNA(Phe)-imidazoG37] synthetase (radical SAM superfamily)